MRLDLRKPMFDITRIHGHNFLFARRAKDLDNLHQLINATVTGKEWLVQQQFGHDTTRRPDVDA